MTPYDELLSKHKMISALQQASGVLGWDQEVMMPTAASDMRAEQLKALSLVIHEKSTDPKIGELLDAAQETPDNKAHLKELRREYDKSTKLPARLVGELTAKTSQAQQIWAEARAQSDFKSFAPILSEIVDLSKERASCLATDGMSHYDALLDEFEPDMRAAKLDQIFAELQAPLVELSQEISERPNVNALTGTFNLDAQKELCGTLMQNMNFSSEWSRLDASTHPFSSGNFDDCRITTRYDLSEPFGSIYSTLHEMGHALYEHGISRDLQYMPAGIFSSMGIHESQSRFVENQIGRCRAYVNWLYPQMNAQFGGLSAQSPEALYHAVNRVERGFIRTEADEVHYNLHVILRYQLERQIIAGDLAIADLEGAWNETFKSFFGMDVPDAAHGVLQDIHWSFGAFGYFPTYTLGNVYSACITQALRKDLPQLDAQVESGQHDAWQAWLKSNIHQFGRTKNAVEIIQDATGEAPSAQPLIAYLQEKFGDIYKL